MLKVEWENCRCLQAATVRRGCRCRIFYKISEVCHPWFLIYGFTMDLRTNAEARSRVIVISCPKNEETRMQASRERERTECRITRKPDCDLNSMAVTLLPGRMDCQHHRGLDILLEDTDWDPALRKCT